MISNIIKASLVFFLLCLGRAVGQMESPDGRYSIEYFPALEHEANVNFKNRKTGKTLFSTISTGYGKGKYEEIKWSADSQNLAVISRGTKTNIDLEMFQFSGDQVVQLPMIAYRLNLLGRKELVSGGRCHFVKGLKWMKDEVSFVCQGNWIDDLRSEEEPDHWYTYEVTLEVRPGKILLKKVEKLPFDKDWFSYLRPK